LPARIELSLKRDGPPMSVIDDLKFDVPLDDSLFDMTVPNGYELRASLPMRAPRTLPSTRREFGAVTKPTVEIPLPETPGPAPTGQELEKLVLKPGVGIGELKLGATRQRVVTVLGQPQGVLRVGAMQLLEYSATGLVLYVDPKGGLQFIMAERPRTSSKSRMRPFAGWTDKLVRIGSTRAEIEAAYGRDYTLGADKVLDHPEIHLTSLMYSRLGIQFTIDSQTHRCTEIFIHFPIVTGPSSRPSP
jgi:hypothetical protein